MVSKCLPKWNRCSSAADLDEYSTTLLSNSEKKTSQPLHTFIRFKKSTIYDFQPGNYAFPNYLFFEAEKPKKKETC